VVSHISDRIAVTYLGKLMELGSAEDVIERPLHPYTASLAVRPNRCLALHLRSARRIVLEGEIPSPISPPSGCGPHPMPGGATALREEIPAWRELKPGHWVALPFSRPRTARPRADAVSQDV